MTEQFQVDLESGRVARVLASIEFEAQHHTDHWLSGGEVRSEDSTTSVAVIDDVEEILVEGNRGESIVRKGSKFFYYILRRLSEQEDIAINI
jgi:hypothetical protein